MRRFRLALIVVLVLMLATPGGVALAQNSEPDLDPDPRPVEPEPEPEPRPQPPEPHPVVQRELTLDRISVQVEIDGNIAVTNIRQTLTNNTRRTVEGSYLLPLPEGATVSDFAIIDGDRRLEPELLDSDEARRTYRDIVRRAKDPGLLEYADHNTYRASVFPFQEGQTRTIEVEFSHRLSGSADLLDYSLPLGWADWSATPRGGAELVISYEINSETELGTVSSPTHRVSVNREGPGEVNGSLEQNVGEFGDSFTLHMVRSGAGEFSASLMCYPDEEAGGGFFQLSLLAMPGEDYEPVPKDVLFVVDQSGSMNGRKIEQARGALEFVLNNLRPDDNFGLIYYSDLVEKLFDDLRPANSQNLTEARDFAEGLEARGGTDINSALSEAAGMLSGGGDRPAYVVFLTDGKPTVGETDVQRIIANAGDSFGEQVRLFVFGVGFDVNTNLLDTLSGNHHGMPSYVTPEESIEREVSSFYSRIATPALLDPELELAGLETAEVMPRETPDLFYNADIFLAGKYQGEPSGTVDLTVSGERGGGERKTYEAALECRESPAGHQIPRLWASRKVNWLLDQTRLHGEDEELIGEIERLATRYGIVTPYTSYLITEGDDEMARDAIRREIAQSRSQASGQGAVQRSKQSAENQSAFQASPPGGGPGAGAGPGFGGPGGSGATSGEDGQRIREVLDLTFRRQETDDGETSWVDTRFDAEQHETVEVETYSDAYFELADAYSRVEKVLALGERVTVVVEDDLALRTVAEREDEVSEGELQRLREALDGGALSADAGGAAGSSSSGAPGDSEPVSGNEFAWLPYGLAGLGLALIAGVYTWRTSGGES